MSKNFGKQILELRSQGYSYDKIIKELGCSRGTVSYHCGQGQKEKTRLRLKKTRKNNYLSQRYYDFVNNNKKQKNRNKGKLLYSFHYRLYHKIVRFSLNKETGKIKTMFSLKELKQKIESNPVCYLTGRKIDLSKTSTYHLDHIIPKSKGGDNSLENCGLTCRDANQAKSGMVLSDFIQLCKDVVEHNNKLNKI